MNCARFRCSLAAMACVLGIGASTCYAESEQIRRLASESAEEREKVLAGIVRERDQTSVAIVNELRRLPFGNAGLRFQRGDKAVVLTRVAGVLRLPESVPVLIDNIEMTLERVDKGTEEKRTLDSDYPALHALIEIGSPAIPFLLNIAEQETTDLRRRLAVVGLVRIFANRGDYVRAILETLRKTATDDKTSLSLQKALAVLDVKDLMTAP